MYLLTSLHSISLFIGFIVLQIYKMSRQEAKNIAEILTKIEKKKPISCQIKYESIIISNSSPTDCYVSRSF